MREAVAAFVDAGNVNIACGLIAGDLDIADEWRAGRNLSRICPSQAVVSRVGNEQCTAADIEIVP